MLNDDASALSAEDLGPALLQRDPDLYQRLLVHARALSARYYGGAVYLVGSAVTSDDPRDIDVVVVIPTDLFLASYGNPGDDITAFMRAEGERCLPMIWRRWARDVSTQGARMTRDLRRAVDFKVLHDRDSRTISDKPRVLLCHVAGGRW